MFSDVLEKISWDETTQKIASKTDADVVRALAKERLDVDDFMALRLPCRISRKWRACRRNTRRNDSEKPSACTSRST